MGSLVRVEGVGVCFGQHRALDGVSLSLERGEMVGLIGPNGSGKSTLLRTISGVIRPQQGRVWLGSEEVSRISRAEVARRVAVVPQNPVLPPAFTAAEVVMLGRTPHLKFLEWEGPRDWAAVMRAMELTQVGELAQRRVGELSGGERQRVVLARSLAQESQVLLLDEPTAHLDLGHQLSALDIIWAMSRQGLAVLAAFHDLNLAAQYCDRLILLNRGRIHAQGPPHQVVTTEHIQAVYQASVHILPHPYNHLPATLVTGKVSLGGNHDQAG